MTTPQPNPTDARTPMWWFERTGMTPSEILAALRPAGVGEAVDCSHGSVYDRLLTFIHDRDCALRGDESTDPTEIDEAVLAIMQIATPAHPDAALMERVRTVLEPFAALAPDWRIAGTFWTDEKQLTSFNPPITVGHVRAIDALLSDLKAEAGR